MSLLLRLASGSGRAAVVRQVLVVVGTAFGAALLLAAAGIAALTRDDTSVSGYAGTTCDAAGRCQEVSDAGSTGSINLDYLVQPGLRHGVVVGFLLTVVPLLVFISTASRVAARRRDERFAALRLAGATQGQVRRLAILDALVGGAVGAVLGLLLFLLARAAAIVVGGEAGDIARGITPVWWLAGLVLLGLLGLVALASVVGLRPVLAGPLEVRRRQPGRTPRPWPLLLLLPVLALPVLQRGNPYYVDRQPAFVLAGLVLTMAGLVLSAPWLTVATGRFASSRAQRADVLLAGRRLADDPRAQARATVPVVLVVLSATLGLVALADSLRVDGGSDGTFLAQGYSAAGVGMLVSLVVGGAGLLLTTAESVLERRRTLAALHAGGAPLPALRRTLLLQVGLPVLPGALLALASGLLLGWVCFGTGPLVSGLGALTLLLPALAVAASVGMTALTLPLLRTAVSVEQLRAP